MPPAGSKHSYAHMPFGTSILIQVPGQQNNIYASQHGQGEEATAPSPFVYAVLLWMLGVSIYDAIPT